MLPNQHVILHGHGINLCKFRIPFIAVLHILVVLYCSGTLNKSHHETLVH